MEQVFPTELRPSELRPSELRPSEWSARATLLARAAKTLAREVELERLFPQIVALATELLAADRSSLFLYDAERDELWSTVAQGMDGREIRFAAYHGLAGYALKTGDPLAVGDAYADPRFNRTWDERTGYRTRSVLVVPVLSRDHEPLGVLQVLNKRGGGAFVPTDIVLLEAFAAHVAVALERAFLTEAYAARQRAQTEGSLVRDVQRSLLPGDPLREGAFDVAAYLAPTERGGGDLYDYFAIDRHRLGFAMGNVAGTGMPAALNKAHVQTLLRAYGREALAPARCLDLIDQANRGPAPMFTSLFYGVLDARTGDLDYCNAGHPQPLLLRSGEASSPSEGALHLPLVSIQRPYCTGRMTMQPGDRLVLYTDGVVEAEASDGARFGEKRLLDVLRPVDGEPAETMVHRAFAALEAFAGLDRRPEDLAVLALRYLG
jgi:sigma-B regulation protein RsbU (phosphoserine phosphatase)